MTLVPVPICVCNPLNPDKAKENNAIPDELVEISLYDLLVQQLDPTVDAQQTEIELHSGSYRWNLLDKKGPGVMPFRGHISRFCSYYAGTVTDIHIDWVSDVTAIDISIVSCWNMAQVVWRKGFGASKGCGQYGMTEYVEDGEVYTTSC